MQLYVVGAAGSVLNQEVSFIQGVLYGEVSVIQGAPYKGFSV